MRPTRSRDRRSGSRSRRSGGAGTHCTPGTQGRAAEDGDQFLVERPVQEATFIAFGRLRSPCRGRRRSPPRWPARPRKRHRGPAARRPRREASRLSTVGKAAAKSPQPIAGVSVVSLRAHSPRAHSVRPWLSSEPMSSSQRRSSHEVADCSCPGSRHVGRRGKARGHRFGQLSFARCVQRAGQNQRPRVVVHAIAVRAIRHEWTACCNRPVLSHMEGSVERISGTGYWGRRCLVDPRDQRGGPACALSHDAR